MSLILRGGLVATMDHHQQVLDPGTLVVEGTRIVEVSNRYWAGGQADTIVDCRGKMVLPGLINAHAHTTEAVFRGCATDLPFLQWLFERNHPLLGTMSEEDAHVAGLLCGIEMLSSGTTCYLDPEVWPEHFDPVARAVEALGLRACLALAMEGSTGYTVDTGPQLAGSGVAADLARARVWMGAAGGRIKTWLGPRVLSAVDENLARILRETSAEWQTGITVHFAEIPEDVQQISEQHGVLPTAYLERLGLMSPRMVLVHGICLEREDIETMARTGARLVHCPASNLKLGNGFAPVPELLESGVVVGLGTDGGMCNDSYDMLREMSLTALIHKGNRHDPHVVSAEAVIRMATSEGARVIGLDTQIGSLEPGKLADITVLDMQGPGWRPAHNPFANLIYGSATRRSVDSVIVDGVLLVSDGQLLHVDVEKIMREAEERAEAVVRATGLSSAVRSPWQVRK